MVLLRKGQAVRLEKPGGGRLTCIAVGLGWDMRRKGGLRGLFGGGGDVDLDASCLLFDAGGTLLDQIWFGQLASRDGSIIHSGDNRTGAGDGDDETISVDLTRLPSEARTLVFTVNSFRSDSFDRVENAHCRVVDLARGTELVRYDLAGSGPHTGLVMAKIVRADGGWTVEALGERTSGRTFHDMMEPVAASL